MNIKDIKHLDIKKYLLAAALLLFLLIIIAPRHAFAASPIGCITSDSTVDSSDLTALTSAWGTSNASADLNADGTVNVLDLSIMLSNWGQSCVSNTVPAIPTGLVATPGDGSVALSWNANPSSDNVDVYQVYVNNANYNLSVSGTSLTVTGLTNGTSYAFRVSAHNSAGYGVWTAVVNATPMGSSGGGGTGTGIGVVGYNVLSTYSNLNQYNTLLFTQSDESFACGLNRPRSIDYTNGTSIPQSYSSGVPWSTANANGWLLTDSSGNLLVDGGYGSNIGDVGNSAYQQAWISDVSSRLAASHCSGVFIDEVARDIKSNANVYPAKYPTQADWQAAMADFISVVGPALKAEGYYVAINASGYTVGSSTTTDGSDDVSWFQQLGPYVNAIMEESWMENANGPPYTLRISGTASWEQYWDGWERLVATCQNMGDDFIGSMYGNSASDTQTMRYGKGSFLLQWNGGNSVFMFKNSYTDNSDPWNLNWTYNIGQPTAAETEPQSGVWERTYTNGIVIVNPTSSTATVSGHTIASADAYIGP